MKPALVGLALVAVAGPLAAQKVNVGVQGVFADYRELGPALSYNGGGLAGMAELNWHKFSGDFQVAKINFNPSSGSAATDKFTSTQFDAHLRWFLASGISLETGYTKRSISPDFTTQNFTAIRAGVRANYGLGPGANLLLRGNYLAAAKFSGGGTAPFALELGLGISVGAASGRWRITGDYEFQRIDRKTSVKVPIQQALARVGAAIGLGR
ncbi:MAG TPA: hypothetical protein VJN62_12965 [Gemmatimonadales bacterium]|nr:hypothetical protein [Gemmatimonadales bacterium]